MGHSRQTLLNEPEDIQWLLDTHLKGVPLPTPWKDFKSFIIYGNEDAPGLLELYMNTDPDVEDSFYSINLMQDDPSIYCTGAVFSGRTFDIIGHEQKFPPSV